MSILVILAVLVMSYSRAARQSFTIDEAWVYNLFVSRELSVMAREYDACNHVVHTLLMKLARVWLGTSELALRVPSLLGALLYCVAALRITELSFRGWTQTLCLALLTLNPLILDLFVAARGYGLAVALFLWALYCALRYATAGLDRTWLFRAGVLSGLAIATNLTILVPAAALGCSLLLLGLREGSREGWKVVDRYGGPAVTLAFLILVIPLLPARPEHFYFGASELVTTARTLVESFLKGHRHWPGSDREGFVNAGTYFVLPMILIGIAGGVLAAIPRYLRSGPLPFRMGAWLLLGGTTLFSVLLLVVLHSLLGLKYPYSRTGLYLLPLLFITPLYGLRLFPEARTGRFLRLAGNLFAAFLVFVCLRQRDNRYFAEWQYDSGTGALMRQMQEHYAANAGQLPQKVRLGTHQFLRHTAAWYRERRKLNWLEDPSSENLDTGKFNYYLLTPAEQDLVSKLKLSVIATDPVSGELLAWRSQ